MYSKIFFSDLVVCNKVRNEDTLSLLVKRLAEGVKQPVSHTRLANLISSAGVKISKSTIIDSILQGRAGRWWNLPIVKYLPSRTKIPFIPYSLKEKT